MEAFLRAMREVCHIYLAFSESISDLLAYYSGRTTSSGPASSCAAYLAIDTFSSFCFEYELGFESQGACRVPRGDSRASCKG